MWTPILQYSGFDMTVNEDSNLVRTFAFYMHFEVIPHMCVLLGFLYRVQWACKRTCHFRLPCPTKEWTGSVLVRFNLFYIAVCLSCCVSMLRYTETQTFGSARRRARSPKVRSCSKVCLTLHCLLIFGWRGCLQSENLMFYFEASRLCAGAGNPLREEPAWW